MPGRTNAAVEIRDRGSVSMGTSWPRRGASAAQPPVSTSMIALREHIEPLRIPKGHPVVAIEPPSDNTDRKCAIKYRPGIFPLEPNLYNDATKTSVNVCVPGTVTAEPYKF